MPKQYTIIKRYGNHLGLFSYVITNLGNIDKAIKQNKLPIIDMQTVPNPYLEENEIGKKNAWELYFQQPCNITLKDIQQKDIITIVTKVPRKRPNDSMSFFLNIKKRTYWQTIAQKYLRLNPEIEKIINQKEKELFKDEKILGVLARGTDYVKLKPFRHPVQPTKEELIEKTKEVLKEQKCTKVFLATEDEEILFSFQKEFKDKLIYNEQKRYSNTENKYLSEIHFNRKNDAYLKGLEYLTTIVLLSKCNSFIAGRTSGTIGVILFNKHFDYTYFYDKGRYKFPKLPSLYKQK